jgi:hypothetical protein
MLQAGRSRVRFPINSFQQHYCPVIDSASKRNEYEDSFLGSKARGTCRAAICEPIVYTIWDPQLLTTKLN